jgi:hypothetical protein
VIETAGQAAQVFYLDRDHREIKRK